MVTVVHVGVGDHRLSCSRCRSRMRRRHRGAHGLPGSAWAARGLVDGTGAALPCPWAASTVSPPGSPVDRGSGDRPHRGRAGFVDAAGKVSRLGRTPLTVGEGGLEPPRPEGHWHLKPARLPFRHSPGQPEDHTTVVAQRPNRRAVPDGRGAHQPRRFGSAGARRTASLQFSAFSRCQRVTVSRYHGLLTRHAGESIARRGEMPERVGRALHGYPKRARSAHRAQTRGDRR